jgi:predicted RNA-binding protein YlqC (UPF0109 family)
MSDDTYDDTYVDDDAEGDDDNEADPNLVDGADPNRIDDADLDDGDDEDEDDVDDVNTVTAASARAVLEYLARAVVDDPDGVDVEVEEGRPVTLSVHVSEGDMGRVIGKRGRVANAIRTVVRAAAARDGVEVDVEFVD